MHDERWGDAGTPDVRVRPHRHAGCPTSRVNELFRSRSVKIHFKPRFTDRMNCIAVAKSGNGLPLRSDLKGALYEPSASRLQGAGTAPSFWIDCASTRFCGRDGASCVAHACGKFQRPPPRGRRGGAYSEQAGGWGADCLLRLANAEAGRPFQRKCPIAGRVGPCPAEPTECRCPAARVPGTSAEPPRSGTLCRATSSTLPMARDFPTTAGRN